jgi:RHS repeat-associated protein
VARRQRGWPVARRAHVRDARLLIKAPDLPHHHDHLGSPRLVVDVQTGEIAQRLDYDIDGRVFGDSSPDFQPFGFAGGLHDVDTGLVRFGARDYDPELARWTAKDPSGFAGGDTNLYAYAYGDSVNFVDPNGELAFLVPFAILVIKGAIAGAATDAGIELATQLIENGGDIGCVDWGDVRSSGVDGLGSGALTGPLGRAFTGIKGLRRAARGGVSGRVPGPTVDPATGQRVGRFVVDSKGNAMIEPAGGRTVAAGRGGVDTHTLYPNGSNYQRLNPYGHPNNPTPHGHGHLPGTGPGMAGQGPSIDPHGNVVPWNSGAAHWPIN